MAPSPCLHFYFMATVTQQLLAIEATKGTVPACPEPLTSTTVGKVLWPEEIETFLRTLLFGRTLHVCCGKSRLGDVLGWTLTRKTGQTLAMLRVRAHVRPTVSLKQRGATPADTTARCNGTTNPPKELVRVASKRVIFQHPEPARRMADTRGARNVENWNVQPAGNPEPIDALEVVSVFDNANS